MHLCEIRAISSPELSRLQAFQAQGVRLRYSWRSWSGVRSLDGMVVFAIAEADVETDDSGCRCLLWSADADARFGRIGSEERLAHCRLAICHGNAEGILLRANARAASSDTLGLRVERTAQRYWALWGSVALAPRLGSLAPRRRYATG